jgi:Tfp pilus assembly protein PilF
MFLQQGCEAQRAGDLTQAINLYQQSLRTKETAEGHTFLGWAYASLGRLDDAIGECKCAIAIDPEYGNPYNDIGSYMIEKGAFDDAQPYLEKALKLSRCDSPHAAHFNLGRVFVQRGMLLKAAEEFRSSLRRDPAFRPAAEGLIQVTETLN